MRPEVQPSEPLSLQAKLDQIARDREILALKSDLIRQGLREGDRVRDLDGQFTGRVLIVREPTPPRIVVATDAGAQLAFAGRRWEATQRSDAVPPS